MHKHIATDCNGHLTHGFENMLINIFDFIGDDVKRIIRPAVGGCQTEGSGLSESFDPLDESTCGQERAAGVLKINRAGELQR